MIITIIRYCYRNFESNNSFIYIYFHFIEHWAEISCDGEKPPPSSRFTLNKIDPSHALLFGGKQEKYTVTYNHVFIYDMDNKVRDYNL